MKEPNDDDMLVAAEWLDVNDGEGGEATGCKAVAEWLRLKVQVREINRLVDQTARQAGVSKVVVRKRLKDLIEKELKA